MKETTLTRRSFIGMAGGTAATLALVGCGGNSGGSTDTNEPADTDAAATVGGGSLTVGSAYGPSSFDPANCSSAFCLSANMNVMEGLYDIDFHDYSTRLGLAADEPVQIDDTTYEITLRDGAAFSDGTPVTPEDVVESYTRASDADGMYYSFLTPITGIEKKDDTTITVTTSIPNFSLLKDRLAIIKIMPATLSADDAAAKPVGSGPWAYDEVSDTYVTLTPNENYNGAYPAQDSDLRIDSLTDPTARVTAQQEGSTLISESVPPESIEQVEAAGCRVDEVQGFGTRFIMFDLAKEPWSDVRVRQAVMYALNTDQMVTNAFSGLATPATSYLPSSFANYHEASTVYTYDLDKAKELIAEAGITPGNITLRTTDNAQVVAMGTQAQQDLQELGFTVDLVSDQSPATYAAIDQADGSWDILIAPGDPSCFGGDTDLLLNWWFGDNIWMNTRCQWVTSPEWQELHDLMEAALAQEGTEQQETWNQCFDILSDNVTLYPILHVVTPTASWSDTASPDGVSVTNFSGIGTTGVSLTGVATATA